MIEKCVEKCLVKSWRALLLAGAALLASLSGGALASTATTAALRVDGQPIPRRLAEDLLLLARRERPDVALPDLLQRLALEWLLGEDARRRVGDERLFASRRVAFDPAAMVERQWQSMAWQRWPEALAQDWARWQQQARVTAPASATAWQRVLPRAAGARLLPAPQALAGPPGAAQVVLLRWCDTAACRTPAEVTLAQVWPSLNVQGRTQILGGDRDFARLQARRWLQDRFTRAWAAQPGRWEADGVQALQELLWARVRWQALLRWEGLDGDAHGAAAGAEADAASRLSIPALTEADLERYWREHPEEFRRLSHLQGWRARCADAACRDAVEPLLRQRAELAPLQALRVPGLSVRAVQWSDEEAPVATPESGDRALDDWSLALMAATPVGAPSPALRHPGVQAQGWEWVQVQRREERLQPLASETVRYGATQALMQQRRQAAWRERQERLLAGAQLQWAPDLAAPSLSPLLGLEAAGGGHTHD
ncbi:hypothetical protein QRD43_00245 [Pelomonas sp. APW6]|uniref:Peptidylprolyl isomerase n=1 Tax=Roseateles subflavus TaxID=3053353 RepID=A0ABT7LBT7_9BURK|nr:hypothetical protein [Pelomonas sp. APW6]MDL5030316.1 hypothetical protein [Pelomonas sp. APW6]